MPRDNLQPVHVYRSMKQLCAELTWILPESSKPMSYSSSIAARPAFMRRSWLRFTDILTCMCNHNEAEHPQIDATASVRVMTSAALYAGGSNPAIWLCERSQSDSKPNEVEHSIPRQTSRQACKRVQHFEARLCCLCILQQRCMCADMTGVARDVGCHRQWQVGRTASEKQAVKTFLLIHCCVESTLWLLLRSPTCEQYSTVQSIRPVVNGIQIVQ